MRKGIWFCMLFMINTMMKVQAQSVNVTGKLITADGLAASGISVYVKGATYATKSNAAGMYTLSLPAGNYEIIFKCLGVLEQHKPIAVTSNTPLDLGEIRLQATAYDLKEVIVTGQYEPQSLKKSVYRVRTINQEQILARASTSVENILNTELGVRFSNDMALGESGIELMGMGGRNVKVLLDGLPMVDRGDLNQSLSQIDVNTIEHIEIVEGPMAVSYGTDALAGVINIITKKDGGDGLSLSTRLQEESAANKYNFLDHNGIHNAHISAFWQNKGWRIGASASRNNFGGYQGDGAVKWMPKKQWFGSGSVGYKGNNWDIYYRLDMNDEDLLNRGELNTNTYRQSQVNYVTDRWTHQLQGQYQVNQQLSLNLSGSFQDYSRHTRSVVHDYRNNTTELSNSAGAQDTSTFLTTVLRTTAQYTLSEKIAFQPGFEFRSDKSSGERIDGEPRIDDYAFFISSEMKLAKALLVRPGLRFIHNSVYDAPPVIPSLNTKWQLSDRLDLRASYGRGFRSPALRELYFVFFDSNHSIQGNQALKAEHSNSYQAGLHWLGVKQNDFTWQSSINSFFSDFRNQITLAIDPDNPQIYTYLNVDKFRTAGGTWENTLGYKNLSTKIGFSYIGRYNELAGEVGEIPSMRWSPEVNATINYTIPKWKAGVNCYYKFNGKRTGFTAVAETDGSVSGVDRYEIQEFNMADLTLNKQLIKGLVLSAGVRNLFNVTDLRNTSLGTGGAHSTGAGPIPISYGRSYFMGLKYDVQIANRNEMK